MQESARILRFIIIGTLNALIMAAVVFVMMEWVGAGYILANVLAYVIAQTHNFIWSKYWVFPNKQPRQLGRQIALFLLAFALAYGAQLVLLVTLVELLGMNEYVAQLLGLLVYGTVNFIMNRRLTFS